MTIKKIYSGDQGPWIYDDTDALNDRDGDFSGYDRQAFITDGKGTIAAATITDLTASRLMASNANKLTVSVTDLTAWIAGTTNQITVTDDTDGTVTLSFPVVYDDMQVSISNIRIPVANAPTERLYTGGISGGVTFPFLGFALNNYIYFDVQSSHSMKLNTIIDNHIHFTLPNTTNIGDKFKFQLDVIAASKDTVWAVPTGSPFTGEHTIVTNDDTYHRKVDIANIPAVNTTISTIYKCKLTRIAASSSEYASEVYITFIDCHYQKDDRGSLQENSK